MNNTIKKELILLCFPCLIFLIAVSIIELPKYPHFNYDYGIKEISFVFSYFFVYFIIKRIKKNGDIYFFSLILSLISIGIPMVYRLKPDLFCSQMLWVLVGFVIFCLSVVVFRYVDNFVNYKYIIGLLGVFLLLVAIVFGTDINGSKSWILLGPIRFQPSEFAKIFIVLFLGAYLIEHKTVLTTNVNCWGPFKFPAFRFIAPLIAIWSLAIMMFLLQRDLGSALLFFGIAVSMTYMSNGNFSYVLVANLFFIIGSVFSYFFFSHVKVRVAIWQNPWIDPTGQAYQIIQSLFAIASGGILGTGFTYGHPYFIPEVHTDFIFSAIAEEFGLLGAVAIILIYILIIYRGFKIALQCRSEMSALIAAGIASSFALQVFIIIAGVTKLIPLTGITLPFLSYGGSSMVTNFIMMGLLFALSEKENNNV